MTWTPEKDDRLFNKAKELQQADANLTFAQALTIAAKSEDARSNGHAKNHFSDGNPEDWQQVLDQRYDAAKAYQEANPGTSFEQALVEAAKQADQGNATAFSRPTKMTADRLAEYDRKNAAKIDSAKAEVEKARQEGRLHVYRI